MKRGRFLSATVVLLGITGIAFLVCRTHGNEGPQSEQATQVADKCETIVQLIWQLENAQYLHDSSSRDLPQGMEDIPWSHFALDEALSALRHTQELADSLYKMAEADSNHLSTELQAHLHFTYGFTAVESDIERRDIMNTVVELSSEEDIYRAVALLELARLDMIGGDKGGALSSLRRAIELEEARLPNKLFLYHDSLFARQAYLLTQTAPLCGDEATLSMDELLDIVQHPQLQRILTNLAEESVDTVSIESLRDDWAKKAPPRYEVNPWPEALKEKYREILEFESTE